MRTIFLLFFLSIASLYGQDTISFRNGNKVAARIKQVEETKVQYHLFTYPDGPLFIKSTNSIAWIKYYNGLVDTFQYVQPLIIPANAAYIDTSDRENPRILTNHEIDSIATSDAFKYYRGSATGTGVFLTTLLVTPVTGFITTLVVSSTPPKYHNLRFPPGSLADYPRYVKSYTETAYAIKRDKALVNFAAGFTISLTATLIYFSKKPIRK